MPETLKSPRIINALVPGFFALLFAAQIGYADDSVNVPDIVAPTFNHEFTKAYQVDSGVKVIATVTDNRGVENVVLFYRVKGTEKFSSMSMEQTSPDLFEVKVPNPQPPGFEYYIQASDIDSNKALLGGIHKPLVLNIATTGTLADADANGGGAQGNSLVEKMQSPERKSKTPNWVWITIGTLVAGSAAVALDNDKSDKTARSPDSEGYTITITTTLPEN